MAAAAMAPTTAHDTSAGSNGGIPAEAAREAGLRYVSDDRPGIRRRRAGKGFRYLRPDGAAVRDEPTLRRIKALVIPPAWTMSGSPPTHAATSRRLAATRKAASSTATTPAGAPSATRPSTSG